MFWQTLEVQILPLAKNTVTERLCMRHINVYLTAAKAQSYIHCLISLW